MFCDWRRRFMNHFFVCLVDLNCLLPVGHFHRVWCCFCSNEKELGRLLQTTALDFPINRNCMLPNDKLMRISVLCSDPKFNFIQCHCAFPFPKIQRITNCQLNKKSFSFKKGRELQNQFVKSPKKDSDYWHDCQSRFYSQIHECRSGVALKKSFGTPVGPREILSIKWIEY